LLLSPVSRIFNHLANELLYKDLRVRNVEKAISGLRETLKGKKNLGERVRSLCVVPGEIEKSWQNEVPRIESLFALLEELPNLVELDLQESPAEPTPSPDAGRTPLAGVQTPPPQFLSITSLTTGTINTNVLSIFLLSLPSLTHLSHSSIYLSALLPPPFNPLLPPLPNLTSYRAPFQFTHHLPSFSFSNQLTHLELFPTDRHSSLNLDSLIILQNLLHLSISRGENNTSTEEYESKIVQYLSPSLSSPPSLLSLSLSWLPSTTLILALPPSITSLSFQLTSPPPSLHLRSAPKVGRLGMDLVESMRRVGEQAGGEGEGEGRKMKVVLWCEEGDGAVRRLRERKDWNELVREFEKDGVNFVLEERESRGASGGRLR
ncbi:hypothetical protein P7C70_g6982, partial [Phenoliferia sp. Uapishka_3]